MIITGQATVTSSAADFNTDTPSSIGGTSLTVYNAGAKTCYLGGDANVTSTNGFTLPAGASFSDDNLGPNDLYAICGGTDTTTLAWIYTRGR